MAEQLQNDKKSIVEKKGSSQEIQPSPDISARLRQLALHPIDAFNLMKRRAISFENLGSSLEYLANSINGKLEPKNATSVFWIIIELNSISTAMVQLL